METIIYQTVGILLGVGIIKLYQFIQYKIAEKKHKILVRKIMEVQERRAKDEMRFILYMFSVGLVLEMKKAKERAKQKTDDTVETQL